MIPILLILDEPTSGLDPVNVELLKDIVLELKAAGKTIIFSTHQMALAEEICDDICLMNRSRKVLEAAFVGEKRLWQEFSGVARRRRKRSAR